MARLFLVMSLLAGWGLSGRAAAPGPASDGPKKMRLFVMVSESLFAAVNRNDAIASMKVWVGRVAVNRGFEFQLKLDVFRSAGEAASRLRENSVDLLMLDTPDYLKLAELRLIEVIAAGSSQGRIGAYPYLLLSRDTPDVPTVELLRGKRVTVTSRTAAQVGLAWLETYLAGNGLGGKETFFSQVEWSPKPSGCVLPLFFGRVDGCVVDAASWELLKELNPQLNRLRVVAQSEALVEGALALPVTPLRYRADLIASILELHHDPAGAQIVTLFRTGPMIRAKEEDFETTRQLWTRYQRLKGGGGVVRQGGGPGKGRP